MDMLGPYELNTIITGDARELAKAIPDESVDLIFTDPVYDRIDDYRWLAETAARVLRPGGWCVAFQYTGYLSDTMTAMSRFMKYQWQIILYYSNRFKYVYSPVGKSTYTPALVYSNGEAKRNGFSMDLRKSSFNSFNSNHVWSKPLDWIAYYQSALSIMGNIVFDPFTGGGTVPAVCKMLRRNYLAFEIDPATADMARQRVAETQPPLLIDMPEQMSMSLD